MNDSILLVEDDPKIREVICDFFTGKEDGNQLECAADGPTALRKFRQKEYDLVLLDVMLPGADGFEVLREIRRTCDVPVIFMTARTLEEDRLYGYELGCDDYVCKPFLITELYAKSMALLRRSKGTVRDEVIRCGQIAVHRHTLEVRVREEEITLAPKELQLLLVLLERKGWVFSRDQLLDLVWGPDYMGNDRVVDNHIRKLRKSLGCAGKQIRTVTLKGYKLVED